MLTIEELFGKKAKEQNDIYCQELRDKLRNDRLTWVLGAGVSVPAGLPQWMELLSKMWSLLMEISNSFKERDRNTHYLTEIRKELQGTLENNEPFRMSYEEKVRCADCGKKLFDRVNVLEAAEYLQNYIMEITPQAAGAEEVVEMVLKDLIRNALIPQKGLAEWDRYCASLSLENESIGRLAKIIGTHKKGTVINYNFDDLFEFCLETIGGLKESKVWVGCDSSRIKGDELIKVYHPHGKIKMFSDWKPEESEVIILTETGYYEMERKVYNWANSIQAEALNNTTCVFIGFSGEDYNFRRIIKNCEERAEVQHYLILGIDSLVKSLYGDEIEKRFKLYRDNMPEKEKVHLDYLEAKDKKEYNREISDYKDNILKQLLENEEFIYEKMQMIQKCIAQKSYWEKRGICPIWTTFAEMPEMIRDIGNC